ncbi:hypothetical protein RIF29_18717 [Crotalaria pallida]|uniref:Uncharacterized protein n=1 Tax=Crotalaria pallida TaxID=3830 RepID=A0AAN9I4V2_CROPI
MAYPSFSLFPESIQVNKVGRNPIDSSTLTSSLHSGITSYKRRKICSLWCSKATNLWYYGSCEKNNCS